MLILSTCASVSRSLPQQETTLHLQPLSAKKYLPTVQQTVLQFGDCHDLIKTLPDCSVVLIYTDTFYKGGAFATELEHC